jgi:hypothetical protein
MPYSNSKYVMTQYAFTGPIAYPPVFPALLAPAYALFGLNITAFKVVVIICFYLALYLISRCLKTTMPGYMVLVIIFLFALNPAIWDFRNHINSDLPFILFCFLSLYLIRNCYRDPEGSLLQTSESNGKSIPYYCLLGLCMYLAYGTREMGLVLPLALLTYELINLRKVTIGCLSALSVFTALAYGQHLLLSGDPTDQTIRENLDLLATEQYKYSGHLNYFDINPRFQAENAIRYARTLTDLFPTNQLAIMAWIAHPLAAIFSLLAAVGYARRLLTRITLFEIFCGGFITAVLLFRGFGGIRYLFPLLPFYFYYALFGASFLGKSLTTKTRTTAFLALLASCIIVFSYSAATRHTKPVYTLATDSNAQQLFAYIENQLPSQATIVFDKPRVLALFTNRYSAAFPPYRNNEFTLNYMRAINADYLIIEHINFDRQSPLKQETKKHKLVKERSDLFEKHFENDHFSLYQVKLQKPAQEDQS